VINRLLGEGTLQPLSALPCQQPQHHICDHSFNNVLLGVMMQCYIGGAVLHLCNSLGAWAVHALWYSVRCLCHTAECHCMYLGCIDLLSAVCWGLPMVVEIYLQCWVCIMMNLIIVVVIIIFILQIIYYIMLLYCKKWEVGTG